ncbi:DUF1178 family protein [Amaricoccus macauensis]|uniref:DUF1178 family protein n=1 Tax=Amaricoccus macauensis TaxID=57001 RepID=UPI003C7DDA37
MIRYTLRCTNDHRFDSWFSSSGDYERLSGLGLVACSICGSVEIEKDLMAPRVRTRGKEKAPDLTKPSSPAEQALAELRRKIESSSEDVGRNFAAEARRIHEGVSPERPIIGEANHAEAKQLIEDGIPVAPLPWSRGKAN